MAIGYLLILSRRLPPAVEARDAMGMRTLDNLDAFFAGRESPDRVA
ncbi:MAG: hypothetical protein WCF85_04185 [Rhodospirillaceae bacterium]